MSRILIDYHLNQQNKEIMKKTFLITITLLTSMFMVAQGDSGFGIKGGLNYGANGDYFESASDAISNPDSNVGYHLGIFGTIGISRLYLRPELVYTKTKSDYDTNELIEKEIVNMDELLTFREKPTVTWINIDELAITIKAPRISADRILNSDSFLSSFFFILIFLIC